MTQALKDDFSTYDLTNDKVIDGPWPPAPTPAAVLANPDELAKPKAKRGRKAGSKNKPKKARKAKAPATEATVPESPATAQPLRIAPAAEDIWPRIRRVRPENLVWLAILVCGVALGLSLAFLTGALKP